MYRRSVLAMTLVSLSNVNVAADAGLPVVDDLHRVPAEVVYKQSGTAAVELAHSLDDIHNVVLSGLAACPLPLFNAYFSRLFRMRRALIDGYSAPYCPLV